MVRSLAPVRLRELMVVFRFLAALTGEIWAIQEVTHRMTILQYVARHNLRSERS